MNCEHYDIIIVGAGLVGSSLVIALADAGLKIALLEKNLPQAITSVRPDTRPLSLSLGSQQILANLGLWSALADDACPIKEVHVSDQGAFGALHISARQFALAALGYVVPFAKLHQLLYQAAAAQVQVFPIEEINSINLQTNMARVVFAVGGVASELTASLIVACDGAQSTTRELLNIPVVEQRSNDVAMTAEISLTRSHRAVAYERFTRDGVLALLPMPQRDRLRLVWTMRNNFLEKVLSWQRQQQQDYLLQQFAGRLDNSITLQWGKHYPLRTVIAQQQVLPGCVLMGNAAHTIYPLAAQGFNLGLREAALLSEVLLDAQRQQRALGDIQTLNQYQRWAMPHQKSIIRFTNRLVDLFELDLPMFKRFRGMGLLLADLVLPLKRRIAMRAMGLAGKQPKLMRGMKEVNDND